MDPDDIAMLRTDLAEADPSPESTDWRTWWRHPTVRVIAIIAVLAVVGAVLLMRSGSAHSVVATPPFSAAPIIAAPTASATAALVVIDVAGKVRRPGLVRLPSGSRVADALAAAGGARPGVSLDSLNLARVLVDGEQVNVGAAAVPDVGGGGASGASPGPVLLNSASAETLDALPGIGPVLAGRIVAWRQAHGPFASVDALTDVPGIGPAMLARLAGLVRV